MANVRYCSSTNSTLFCTNCDCAVLDNQTHCPGCKEEIFPTSAQARHNEALWVQLGDEEYAKHKRRVAKLIKQDKLGVCTGE